MPDRPIDSADAVGPAIRRRIEDKLARLSDEEDVRILYAAESGSRAWGFGSPDSDYDVRFIYVREMAWYLRLRAGRDVVEAGIDSDLIDLSGWDADKALKLLLKSNPALYEWLVSPIVYIESGGFAARVRQLYEKYADRQAIAHHYRNIAGGQWRREIVGKSEVKQKKYFYVIRPLLSLQWVRENRMPPPMTIDGLLEHVEVSATVRRSIEELIAVKRATPELGLGPRLSVIDDWIESGLALSPSIPVEGRAADRDALADEADKLFLELVGHSGSGGGTA